MSTQGYNTMNHELSTPLPMGAILLAIFVNLDTNRNNRSMPILRARPHELLIYQPETSSNSINAKPMGTISAHIFQRARKLLSTVLSKRSL